MLTRIIHENVEETKGRSIFADSRSAARDLPSFFQDTFCLSIGQVKPLKHYVLPPCREIYE